MKQLIFYIKAFFQLLWKMVVESIYYTGKFISFKRACKLARRRFSFDHKTYYVVESSRWTFFVGNSSEIDKLKRMRVFSRNVDARYLDNIACYKIGRTCPKGTDYSERLTFNKNEQREIIKENIISKIISSVESFLYIILNNKVILFYILLFVFWIVAILTIFISVRLLFT